MTTTTEMMKREFRFDEITCEEAGEIDQSWHQESEHRCDMGPECCTKDGQWLGIVLEGDHDQPRWNTPWELVTDDIGERKFVCEDCACLITHILEMMGMEERK